MSAKILAHRGASAYRPENTLESFLLAVEQKADGFELDVHFSKDGVVVVAHDEELGRVSDGTGLINDHTLEELKAFNFNKLFPDQPVCRMPTLAEVFSLARNTDLIINIELKTTRLFYPGLAEKLVKLVHGFDMQERVIYSSFNHYSLLEIKQRDPSAKTGLLYELGLVDPWVYAKYAKADAIHPHYFIIASLPETVKNCHENGIAVNVWTVDDPKAISLMMSLGVDAVITNKPDAAFECRTNLGEGRGA